MDVRPGRLQQRSLIASRYSSTDACEEFCVFSDRTLQKTKNCKAKPTRTDRHSDQKKKMEMDRAHLAQGVLLRDRRSSGTPQEKERETENNVEKN